MVPDLKQRISTWKLLGFAILGAFLFLLIYSQVDQYIEAIWPEDWRQGKLLGELTIRLGFLLIVSAVLVRQYFFKKVHRRPRSKPYEISKLIVEVGASVQNTKEKVAMIHKQNIEIWLNKNVKLEQLPDLLEKGEMHFTTSDGAGYDLLIDFILFKDSSDQKLETMAVSKGNKQQIDFLRELNRDAVLEWKCDHINFA